MNWEKLVEMNREWLGLEVIIAGVLFGMLVWKITHWHEGKQNEEIRN